MLTQNVSDVLSSTAFMNLAARFPGWGCPHPACRVIHHVLHAPSMLELY